MLPTRYIPAVDETERGILRRAVKAVWPGMNPPRLVGGIKLRIPSPGAPLEMVTAFSALQAAERDQMLSKDCLRQAAFDYNERWKNEPEDPDANG